MNRLSPTLSILLPCYNPPRDWAKNAVESFAAVRRLLPETAIDLVLVNDGSQRGISDGDIAMLRAGIAPAKLTYKVLAHNRGKGFALRAGVEVAEGEVQVYTDVDFPYEAESLAGVYKKLAAGEAEVAAGVRDTGYYKQVPPFRKFISKSLRALLRSVLRLTITDTQCGLKGFNAAGRATFLQTRINRFLFDLEFIFLASNDPKIRVVPCDVQLKPGVVFSKMSWGILAGEAFNFLGIFFRALGKRVFGGKS